MYRERKETTLVEIGEETHTSSYLYENKVQCMSINGYKTSIQEAKERKEKYIRTSLHPSKSIHNPPIKNVLY